VEVLFVLLITRFKTLIYHVLFLIYHVLMLNSLGSCGVRFNPGLGSGGTEKTNVGGPSASFGIWHTEKENVQALAAKYNITIKRIHTHIGSGSDPSVWINAASMSLSLVDFFSTVTILNLGESV
jgi:diaminopimelate decarboxylase